jgi:predicted GIY-YIG superfamily endonuclease
MKPFFVYILKCSDRSYYIGHTDDLERRIECHTEGIEPCYTANRRPLELVFVEECTSREEALGRERQIKKWRREKKEALIRNDWDSLKKLALSKSHPSTPLRANGIWVQKNVINPEGRTDA